MSDDKRIATLIGEIRESGLSDFYRNTWGDIRDFEKLPSVTREDFLAAPLAQRRYKNEKALVKIVHAESGSFLSEWAFSDIAAELWGLPSQRPMVYLSDPHAAIEKSLWCYEHGMVPLVGERDPDIAMYAAGKYRIDSLITDAASLASLRPYLAAREFPLESITVIDSSFDVPSLLPFNTFARRGRLVLALPETGGYAEAELAADAHFSPFPDCVIERDGASLLITKLRNLVTPIIKYRISAGEEHIYDVRT